MHATVGDRVHIKGRHVGRQEHVGEILEYGVWKESRPTWCGTQTDTSRSFTQGPTVSSNNEVLQINNEAPAPSRNR